MDDHDNRERIQGHGREHVEEVEVEEEDLEYHRRRYLIEIENKKEGVCW
jgi:hypothetical protein